MMNIVVRKMLSNVVCVLVVGLFCLQATCVLPKENVVDVPAIGKGLCVHNVFQSNMVIQRDKPVKVWGWADVGEKISVSFGDEKHETIAGDDRLWKITLGAMGANAKPQVMVVKGEKKTLRLDNILVGDVWVLGGQSNMEFPISKVENGSLEIASANFPNIRILTVPAQAGPELLKGFPRLHEWSSWSGRHFRKGDWSVCSPDTVGELSAIGYVFARRIYMAVQVPIGVVDVSRGGTTVETWTPNAVLRNNKHEAVKTLLAEWDEKIKAWDAKADLENRIKRHHQWVETMEKQGKEIPADRVVPNDLRPGPAMDRNRPGNSYAGTIASISGFAVKGTIFHQGYNNCFNGSEGALMYEQVFPEMIKAWRVAFDNPEMPFGILSLCTAGNVQTRDNFTEMMGDVGPMIREAQYKAFLNAYNDGDKNIGFVSTFDLRRRWYHPQLKIPAGERIARWALATQYGFEKQIMWKPPMLNEMKVEGDKIILKLDVAVGAVDDGSSIEGFAVAGEDRKFHPADVSFLVIGKDNRGRDRTDNKSLVLSSVMVPRPVHFRYAWGRSPMGNLQLSRNTDVPFATQRSDDWRLESVPLSVFGEEQPEQLDRGQRRKLQDALRNEDVRRKLYEAELFIKEYQDKVDEK